MKKQPLQPENPNDDNLFNPAYPGQDATDAHLSAPGGDDDDDDDDDDDEITREDWGDIDPQPEGTGPMDPSGPGSAV